MSNVNNVTLSGNLTADPEVVADGKITKLRIAVNSTRKVDDEYVEEASFFDVKFFGNFAALVARKVRKGDAVTVQGKLKEERWKTEDDQNRSKVVINAYELDGAAMYRKDEDVPAAAEAAPAGSSQGTSDDDIPF